VLNQRDATSCRCQFTVKAGHVWCYDTDSKYTLVGRNQIFDSVLFAKMANTSFGLDVLSTNILDFDKICYTGRSDILMAVIKKVKFGRNSPTILRNELFHHQVYHSLDKDGKILIVLNFCVDCTCRKSHVSPHLKDTHYTPLECIYIKTTYS